MYATYIAALTTPARKPSEGSDPRTWTCGSGRRSGPPAAPASSGGPGDGIAGSGFDALDVPGLACRRCAPFEPEEDSCEGFREPLTSTFRSFLVGVIGW